MRVLAVIGFIALALSIVGAQGRKNKGKGKSSVKNPEGNNATDTGVQCLGQTLTESKYNFGLTECINEIMKDEKLDSRKGRKLLKKNSMCIKLCQRKKQGILDAVGKLSATGANHFVEDLFPQKARARINIGLVRCADDNEHQISTTNNCRGYKRFEKCVSRIVTKSCGLKNERNSSRSNKHVHAKRKGNQGKNKENQRNQEHHDVDAHTDDDEHDSEMEE